MARIPDMWWWMRIMSSMSMMTGVVGVRLSANSVCSFVSSTGQRSSASRGLSMGIRIWPNGILMSW